MPPHAQLQYNNDPVTHFFAHGMFTAQFDRSNQPLDQSQVHTKALQHDKQGLLEQQPLFHEVSPVTEQSIQQSISQIERLQLLRLVRGTHNKEAAQQLYQTSKSKRVSFGTVEVREYARCLGDNPSSSPDGPSLSIDWIYMCCGKVALSRHEQKRAKRRKNSTTDTVSITRNEITTIIKSKRKATKLTGEERKKVIKMHTDCTEQNIHNNIEELNKVRIERMATNLVKYLDGYHLFLENCQDWWRGEENKADNMGISVNKSQGEQHHFQDTQESMHVDENYFHPNRILSSLNTLCY